MPQDATYDLFQRAALTAVSAVAVLAVGAGVAQAAPATDSEAAGATVAAPEAQISDTSALGQAIQRVLQADPGAGPRGGFNS